jgi:hypothetical protein
MLFKSAPGLEYLLAVADQCCNFLTQICRKELTGINNSYIITTMKSTIKHLATISQQPKLGTAAYWSNCGVASFTMINSDREPSGGLG